MHYFRLPEKENIFKLSYLFAQLLRNERLKDGEQDVEQHRVVDHVDAPQPERACLLHPVQYHAGVLRGVLGDLRHRKTFRIEYNLNSVELRFRIQYGALDANADGGNQFDDRHLRRVPFFCLDRMGWERATWTALGQVYA